MANPYPNSFQRHFSTKINKEQAREGGEKRGYKDSAICLPPTVFFILTPSFPRSPFPLPSGELNCRLPSRHSCARSSSPSSLPRSSPFFILSRYASDGQAKGIQRGLRDFLATLSGMDLETASRAAGGSKSGKECTNSGEFVLLPSLSVLSLTFQFHATRA